MKNFSTTTTSKLKKQIDIILQSDIFSFDWLPLKERYERIVDISFGKS